jgi:hypothetical protein
MTFRPVKDWSATDDKALLELAAGNVSPGVMATRFGRSEVSVTNRLRQLEEAGRPRKTKRQCMCCKGDFMSDGPHNRLCNRCRRTEKTCFDF